MSWGVMSGCRVGTSGKGFRESYLPIFDVPDTGSGWAVVPSKSDRPKVVNRPKLHQDGLLLYVSACGSDEGGRRGRGEIFVHRGSVARVQVLVWGIAGNRGLMSEYQEAVFAIFGTAILFVSNITHPNTEIVVGPNYDVSESATYVAAVGHTSYVPMLDKVVPIWSVESAKETKAGG